MPATFVLSAVTSDDVATVRLSGEVDLTAVPLLQSWLARALAAHQPPRVDVDLTGLRSIDSFALSALMGADRYARDTGGWMTVTGVDAPVRALLAARGLDRVLDLRPSGVLLFPC
ncbi:STAS domain-containing protein [Nonomuraea africana]|uniref:Anti-sigma factor antagonist n=1 Tax=Nonomuraea africana TaxID=46171 RepID=A0ABR9KWG6_9ACTN|nr:STAS domain-containing protein [Nonomuraea africana]MBE1566081.1 anti-anti-sigma factor [Nonomuraea africana]